jgi:hypothetical protein
LKDLIPILINTLVLWGALIIFAADFETIDIEFRNIGGDIPCELSGRVLYTSRNDLSELKSGRGAALEESDGSSSGAELSWLPYNLERLSSRHLLILDGQNNGVVALGLRENGRGKREKGGGHE